MGKKKDQGVKIESPKVFYIVDEGPSWGYGDDEDGPMHHYAVFTRLKDLAENVEDDQKVIVVSSYDVKTVKGSTIELV